MKKVICISLIFFNLAFIHVDASHGTARLETDKEKIQQNENFTLSFYMDGLEEVYGFEMYIHYDDSFLMPLQKTLCLDEGLLTKDLFIVTNKINNREMVLVGTLLGKEQKIKSSRIFYAPFKALKDGTTRVTIDALKLLNENGEKLKVISIHEEIFIAHEKSGKKKSKDHTENSASDKGVYVNIQDENVDNIKIQAIDIHKIEEYKDKICKSNILIIPAETIKFLYKVLELLDVW
ncbi:cohesin domain-containing protein [Marinisporobacter balticus]|uniref:Uncharacterized protein n=1 Tax=Marinisporobacter balticus TaxID=2018667 RepID=A0A4R2LHE6_9FIRM|nr:cohesin domain-containing protein [Marinisporobacter balticus]TCO78755.1 hypothetical protein EV214_104142 [Marinisporobacter balticus]